jgi:predicted nucleotidyltransferase
MTNEKISNVMQLVIKEAQSLFGDKLEKVAIFGSYARGDFIEGESDLDIALFMDCEPHDIVKNRESLIDATLHLDTAEDIYTSYRVIPLCQWEIFKDSLDLYVNIARDGVFYYDRTA